MCVKCLATITGIHIGHCMSDRMAQLFYICCVDYNCKPKNM